MPAPVYGPPMPHLADIIFIAVVALAVIVKGRCIWRGCTVPQPDSERRNHRDA